jgi:Uma2 family endonuclease
MPAYDPAAVKDAVDYPTGDGKPMAETPTHRDNMIDLIAMLRTWYSKNPDVYISGNMLLYYEEGNKHKHVSPDVFVAHGVPKDSDLDYYATWREGKGPDLVIEVTSRSTRKEDTEKKFRLYQHTLHVPEYFLFDPYGEYLKPPLQGYRLKRGRYVRIKPVRGRLPSEVIGLQLERSWQTLRFYDPAAKLWVPTGQEKVAQADAKLHQAVERSQQAVEKEQQAIEDRLRESQQRLEAEAERQRAVEERQRAVEEKQRAVEEKQQAVEALLREARARLEAEAEIQRLRQELDALRRTTGHS